MIMTLIQVKNKAIHPREAEDLPAAPILEATGRDQAVVLTRVAVVPARHEVAHQVLPPMTAQAEVVLQSRILKNLL
jgi:hypothetical protein